MTIKTLGLVGVGLIGGSLAAALRELGQVERIIATARRTETLDTARYLGLIDEGSAELAPVLAEADVVMLAVPMGAYRDLFARMRDIWPEQAVVTDAGSTKLSVLQDAEAVLGRLPPNLVPGHPVAGTERSGPAAAEPSLFRHRRVILTPHEHSDERAVATVQALWEGVGARVSRMSAQHHDEVLGLTSHLPHVLAYQLIDTLAAEDEAREIFAFAAGGLKDLTRIASSNPEMWSDIMAANQESVVAALDAYLGDLAVLREELAGGRRDALRQRFARAKAARDQWIHTADAH